MEDDYNWTDHPYDIILVKSTQKPTVLCQQNIFPIFYIIHKSST